MINSWLPEVSQVCLSYTCRYFHGALDPPPSPRRPAIQKFNLEREGRDPTLQRLTCSQCLRLRRFFHFDKKQASRKTTPDTRRCLDCLSSPKRLRKLLGQPSTWLSATKITVCPHCRQMVVYEAEDNYYEVLIISSHVGEPVCARHHHRVRVRNWCAGGAERRVHCSARCNPCHQHCSTPDCPDTVHWGERLCGKGHKNNRLVWNVPEQPPSGPEIIVSRLREMLDQVRPPPLRSDFFQPPRQGRKNDSISELIQSLLSDGQEHGKLLEGGKTVGQGE